MRIEHPTLSCIPALRNLWQEAFGDTEDFLNAFFTTAFSPHRCLCVTIDETLAAALYWFDCQYRNEPIAYIYAVATAKAFRGQGICHKLMAGTHRHLTVLGYKGAILVPGGKDLFRFYEDIGYQTCCSINHFSCTTAGNAIPIREIDKKEYTVLRRTFLPQDGVIQESHNMDFLETQATFYSGPDFLLAARQENDTLYGVELLGNASAAPDILVSLQYSKGTFRVPGETVPFAMYYPLGCKELPPPAYFGLPFD